MSELPIDADIERLLTIVNDVSQPRIVSMTPEEARAWSTSTLAPPDPPIEVASVADRIIPGPAGSLAVRVYHPVPDEPRPLLIFFHGGGWVLGDLDAADPTARRLAVELDAVVASVDYRLAPEHPYPAGPEDAIAATRWLAEHAAEVGADPERVGVGGDSAGGHLAAVAAIAMRNEGGPRLNCQYLIYPVTDSDFTRESMVDNARGRLLETEAMAWFWDHFCPDLDRRAEWLASPIRIDDMSGLPPAIVALAAHDPLYSEGLAYARRLEDAGVPTTVKVATDLIHGYFSLEVVGTRCLEEIQIMNRLARPLLHASETGVIV
jgi:acetyl esterase